MSTWSVQCSVMQSDDTGRVDLSLRYANMEFHSIICSYMNGQSINLGFRVTKRSNHVSQDLKHTCAQRYLAPTWGQ